MAHQSFRVTNMRQFLTTLAKAAGMTEDALEANTHPYYCRCDKCKEWWRLMGQDQDTKEYGPFTKEEIEDAR